MSLTTVVFVACVAACAIAHAAILASVARRPAQPADPGVPRSRRGVEILWALLPAVALALVLTATWERVRQGRGAADDHGAHEVMKVAR